MEKEMKIAGQRAAVMGLLTSILHDEEECTLKEMKDRVLACLSTLIVFDMVVGDSIDDITFQAGKQHCKEQMALEEVREILESNN